MPSRVSLDLPAHGGDIAAAEARFGRPRDGWLDLSTGINPHAYPIPTLAAPLWHHLPGQDTEQAMLDAARRCYGVAEAAALVAGPGSQALIQWLPRLFEPTRVAVIGPTYGEHASAWAAAGHDVATVESHAIDPHSRVVIVVNPNNPDGYRWDPQGLLALAEALHQRQGLLVVDEAFADVAPELSLSGHIRPGLVVLRSFGKFFGLAGVRLGFALCAADLAAELRCAVGPWAVSGPTLALATQALADPAWIGAMRRRLHGEAVALDDMLSLVGLPPAGGTDLFRLVVVPRAWGLYEHLGSRGILVRAFADAPRWLRFGLPGSTGARERLRQALLEWPG